MAATASRWFCHGCQREFVDAWQVLGADGLMVKWTQAMGCPSCRSHEIVLVIFEPTIRGGDIDRTVPNRVVPAELVEVLAGGLISLTHEGARASNQTFEMAAGTQDEDARVKERAEFAEPSRLY